MGRRTTFQTGHLDIDDAGIRLMVRGQDGEVAKDIRRRGWIVFKRVQRAAPVGSTGKLRRGLGMEMRETPTGPQAAITSDADHTLVVEFGRKESKPIETKALHWQRSGMPEGQFALSAKAVPETGFMRRSLDAAAD